MKKIVLLLAFICLFTTISCKKEKREKEVEIEKEVAPEVAPEVKKIKIILEPKSGSNVNGNAVFTEEEGAVKLMAVIDGLKPGKHAIHLHEKADCASEDGKSAGGHWNPTAQPHGKWGDAAGYHKGDIGNLVADANGNALISFKTKEWCIGCGDKNKDIIGKAIIVHEGADDYGQPTGNAGGRVSCGGIIQ